ncbi:Zinc transporter 6 [Apodemus speciosus]|uniref:Zinc transporter 6 n=1 Tax=Apodemus speciosus TaxID=105296 RepID=A0ABQ0ENH5_APOSI
MNRGLGAPGRREMTVAVLPVHTTATPSSSIEEKHPKSSSKVETRRGRNIFKILRNVHHNGAVIPRDAEQPQAQVSMSIEKPQVIRKKSPHVLECPHSATLPVAKEKAPVIMVEVVSRKRRCVSTVLKNISRKRAVAPLEMERPKVLAGTSRETAHATTEVVPKNADAAPVAGGQAEPPVGMEKVATKRGRRRGMCRNTTVTTQDTERPSVSEAVSKKATEVKTKDLPDIPGHADNILVPDVYKKPSEPMESEEARKRRRISQLIRRIEQKRAMFPQYEIGTQAFGVTSLETTVRNEKVTLCSPGCPGTHSVDHAGLELRNLPVSASQVLELKNAAAPSPVEEKPSVSVTKVEPIRFKRFTSLLERFCKKNPGPSQAKKDPGPSQALEEPPVLESTSKEIPQTRKRGTENVPDIKQIFFREEEFEPHDEGSWEEYKSS